MRWENSEKKFSNNLSKLLPLELNLLNIQGLIQAKLLELEDIISLNSILCITETHKKCLKFNLTQNLISEHSFRKEGDKKGGGLSILMRESKGKKIENLEARHSDVLHVRCTIGGGGGSFDIVLVYLASDDIERDDEIEVEIVRILNNISLKEIPYVLLGDFNSHLGFIGPQPVDGSGNRVLNWMIAFNLILLNGDINCTGEITWSSRGLVSAIDFIFVNNVMYEKFRNMVIDEDKERFDLSDHNLLSAYFNISMKTPFYSNKKKEIFYYKFTEENEKKFLVELENRVRSMGREENGNLAVYEECVRELAIREFSEYFKLISINIEINRFILI